MIVHSQSGIDEILKSCELMASRELLENWPPSSAVRVMTVTATEGQTKHGNPRDKNVVAARSSPFSLSTIRTAMMDDFIQYRQHHQNQHRRRQHSSHHD